MDEILEIGEPADGQVIEIRVHQTLRIVLPEVRTAGFRWTLRALRTSVCSVAKEDFDPPAGAAGGAGRRHWELRAEEVGTAEILIEYGRPWEHGAPARSYSVSIRVR